MNKKVKKFKEANPWLFYETEKKPVQDLLPDYEPPFGQDHCIVTHTESGPVITNFCSKGYNLVTNEQLLIPILEAIVDEYPHVDIEAVSQRDARFYVDFVFDEKHVIGSGKKKLVVDEINPRFRVVNSYDGKIRYSREFGFYRVVCSNGMVVPEGESILESGLHTESLDDMINQEALIQTTKSFLENAGDFLKPYQSLRTKAIGDLETRIMDTIENTKFPKRQAEAVAQRILSEMDQLKSPANDWLVYNGFNGELNHSDDFAMTISKRNQVDKQVLDFLLAG